MRALRFLALALLAAAASGQDADWPEADPADVVSIDAIVDAAYEAISGPADEERDWDRFRSLYLPTSRLIPTGRAPDGTPFTREFTPDSYAETVGQLFRESPMFRGRGFYEVEAAQHVERYGNIAHVWSTYESRFDPGEEPYAMGINSIQLFWSGERWHILSVTWQEESDDTPIPSAYLPE